MDEKEKELEPIDEKELEPIEKPGSMLKALMLQGLGLSKLVPVNLTKYVSIAAKTGKMFAAAASGGTITEYSVGADFISKAVASFLPSQIGTPTAENPITITGYTGANLFVFGKNLFDINNRNGVAGGYFSSGKIQTQTGRVIYYVKCSPNTTYTVQKIRQVSNDRFSVAWTKIQPASGVDIFGQLDAPNNGTVGTKSSLTITTGADAAYLAVWLSWQVSTAATINAERATFQIEVGSSATDYASFVGTTYVEDWTADAGTVFGGSIDFVSGLLISEWDEIASYAGEDLPGPWYSSIDGYNESGTPTTGAQVVYKLAEPVEYELDPQIVNFNVGENTIYSDVGPVDIIY